MCRLFRREKSAEYAVDKIINNYFNSGSKMLDADYNEVKGCLERWSSLENTNFLGAMAYVRYGKWEINKMWDYIEEDLSLKLVDEEHGTFIPTMIANVELELRSKIIKKIRKRTKGVFSPEILARVAKEIVKEKEVLQLAKKCEKSMPKVRRIKKNHKEMC